MPERFDPLADLSASIRRAGACRDHPALRPSVSPADAQNWYDLIRSCAPNMRREHLRWFALNDLFFLLVFLLHRTHFLADERRATWTFARCKEVQEDPDGRLDLWPREHFKSEILTFGKTIQDILADSNETFGLFSHTRPMAKQFLRQIKTELTANEELKELFSDVLWMNPEKEAPKWSEDDGIVLKRQTNRKEMTIEAWGLVDGQPTSKRFTKLVFDDVVSRDKISDDMIRKTTAEIQNAFLLTASDPPIFRYVATFQEIDDTTQQLLDKGIGVPRIRGPLDGEGHPACFSDEKFAWFQANLSPKIFALQILLDPTQAQVDEHVGFERDWLRYYTDDPPVRSMNIYIVVDPAGKSRESNSRFALWVLGLMPPHNVFVLDAVLDKLDLGERGRTTVAMYRKFEAAGNAPQKAGYETYGMQGDIEYIRELMQREHYMFQLVPLSGTGKSKDDRIELLIPDFRANKVWLPARGIKYTPTSPEVAKDLAAYDNDIVKYFVEREYMRFPHATKQKDLLDAMARIKDPALSIVWPRRWGGADTTTGNPWGGGASYGGGGSWLSG